MQDAVIPHLDTSMNFFKLSLMEPDFGNNIIYSVKKEKKKELHRTQGFFSFDCYLKEIWLIVNDSKL